METRRRLCKLHVMNFFLQTSSRNCQNKGVHQSKRICSPASNGRFYVNTGKRTNRLGRKYKLRYCRCACLERDGGQAEIIPDYWPHKKVDVKFDIGTRKEPTVPPGFMKISVCKGTERVCLETGAVSVVEPHLKNPETQGSQCAPH